MGGRIPLRDRLLMALADHNEMMDEGLHGWRLTELALSGGTGLAQLNRALRLLMNEKLIHKSSMESDPADPRGATYTHVRITSKGREEADLLRTSYLPWWKKGLAWTTKHLLIASIGASTTIGIGVVVRYLLNEFS